MATSDFELLNECFGSTLGRLRKTCGLSQEEFGFECGLSRQFISLLERGKSSPSLGTVARVAAGLKMSEDHLVKIVFDHYRSCPGVASQD